MPRYLKRHAASTPGFSIVELMVVVAVVGILVGVAVPNVQTWRRNYNVKSAVTDLYANMQLARIGAIKNNQPWRMQFFYDPANSANNSYTVIDAGGRIVKEVMLSDRYKGSIVFGRPEPGSPIENPSITFRGNGMSDNGNGITAPGFVYLTASNHPVFYRVGMRSIVSTARIQRRQGTWPN